jgi:hypothetical protein
MRLVQKVALAAALLPLVATPVSAQRWKWDFGVNGGYSWLTNMLDEDQTGLSGDEIGGSKIRFDSGWLVGSQLGYWFGPSVGLRANFRYADRDVVGNNLDDFSFVDAVNLWGGTIDLMYRFKKPAAEYTGTEFLPYIALGAGLKWQNPGGDQFTCIDPEESDSFACGPFTTGLPAAARTFVVAEESQFAGLVGLGADWRVARNWSIRTELSDQIFKPQIFVALPTGVNTYTLTNGDDRVANTVHELGAQVGVHYLFGVPRPTPVAIVPAPPAPTPPPPPPPPPAPREETITVCVIDPVAPGGIRTESAIFLPERGDTLVTVNGQRVPLRSSIGSVMVASSADWYVRGAPMTMMIGKEKVEFVTTSTPRIVEASELAFLGTVNGLPVYADKDDVQDVREELDELNRAQRGTDLAKILEEHKDLRTDLADVKVYYVPMQPVGCVFQALQMQEQVRKNKEQQQ